MSSDVYRAARAALEREYRDLFGREWDEPPWGRSRWGDIIPKALELDRTYMACLDHIEGAILAVDRAREFLLRRGLDIDAPSSVACDSMLLVGKTVPERLLYLALIRNEAVVARAGVRLRALLSRLRAVWNTGVCDIGGDAERPRRAGFIEAANTVVPLRGLHHLEITRPDGTVFWSGWSPGIYAPPPNSLRTDSHEWRRWYIATVLQSFDRAQRRSAPDDGSRDILELDVESRRYVKDRDVAVVSLLAGGLELFSVAELSNLPDVVNAERKAVALARRRARIALAAHWKQPAVK